MQKARFKRANDTNELNGIKIDYLGLTDDQQDPAVALTQARRLVTAENVFAIVPTVSAETPGAYLTAQHVPWVGWGIDSSYCTTTPSTSVYGFGYNGCSVPANPPAMPDTYAGLFQYVKTKSGKAQPSVVLFSNDDESGHNSTRLGKVSATGAGFNVVFAAGSVPITTSDYSPYVQEWMHSDSGHQPDAIVCQLAVQCIPIWTALKAAGFTGVFETPLYTDALLKALAGTVSIASYNPAPSAALTQMQNDLNAVKPGTKIALGSAAGYFGADMFIQAVKKVGRNITPEAVQQALATQTWQIAGLVGPATYPQSSVVSTPVCGALVSDSDGTAWTVLQPYSCSSKTYPVTG